MSEPLYSIIVPSFNRREEIEELLQSFSKLDFPRDRFELIIADDGSTDDTEKVVKGWAADSDLDLRFFRQENRGPGAARNMGMRHARGDWLIFIDSDCTVDVGWLTAIDRGLRDSDADAFGGPDSFKQDFPPLLKAINYSMTSFVTTGGIRGQGNKRLGKYYPRSFNMGLSRETYVKAGGFGNLRHGQDIEFSHRIIKSGAKVVLIPDAVVYHKRRTSLRRFFRQVFNWGVARINLYKLDREMLEAVHGLPAIATLVLAVLLAVSLTDTALRPVAVLLLASGLIILAASGIHAAAIYRNARMLYLVPAIMPLQILGYGAGFLAAFVWRVVLNRGEFRGFHRRYYQ